MTMMVRMEVSRSMFRKRGHRGSGTPNQARLSELCAGDAARIVFIHGGRGFREKMNGMGFFPGTGIGVVQTVGNEGMMLISIGSSRIMVGHRMACRIYIERIV